MYLGISSGNDLTDISMAVSNTTANYNTASGAVIAVYFCAVYLYYEYSVQYLLQRSVNRYSMYFQVTTEEEGECTCPSIVLAV